MNKSTFRISKMDCPSEETLIRLKIQGNESVVNLDFDIPNRKLVIYHNAEVEELELELNSLKLGEQFLTNEIIDDIIGSSHDSQRKVLVIVLCINFIFFLIELFYGYIANSLGLISDSLDMLADSFVYGISLLVIGKSTISKKKVSRIAGYTQIILASLGFYEVFKRFIGDERMPNPTTMIVVSILALLANTICLMIFQKNKSKEVHMRTSMIFTSNDIIINLGVVMSGILVIYLDSNIPDLVIGAVVLVVVSLGAIKIFKLSI